MNQKKKTFPKTIKKQVLKRSKNRCERCNIDFDDDFTGEFHHIKPVVYGGKSTLENCTLLCRNCHQAAPNVKTKEDLIIYKNFFMKFASFKEAAKHYNVETRIELYTKIAQDIAEEHFKKS